MVFSGFPIALLSVSSMIRMLLEGVVVAPQSTSSRTAYIFPERSGFLFTILYSHPLARSRQEVRESSINKAGK
jgi:hypothetical protein